MQTKEKIVNHGDHVFRHFEGKGFEFVVVPKDIVYRIRFENTRINFLIGQCFGHGGHNGDHLKAKVDKNLHPKTRPRGGSSAFCRRYETGVTEI